MLHSCGKSSYLNGVCAHSTRREVKLLIKFGGFKYGSRTNSDKGKNRSKMFWCEFVSICRRERSNDAIETAQFDSKVRRFGKRAIDH